MRYVLSFLVAALIATASLPAHADKRIALVIGNSAYENTAELRNPTNDAADLAARLRRLGFDVLEGRDLDKRGMERLIRQFGTMLSGADLAFFYYAGHGIQVGSQNYLVPIDARLASEADIDFESLPLMLVLKQMEREAKTSLVLLDACRDNPLARNLARSMGTRSAQVGQGLAEVKTGVGTLIGFSTQPGNVAVDGTGHNSPYAAALLKYLDVPGKDVSAVLVAVRNDVLKATNGTQVPWEHTSLTGEVFLNPVAAAAPPSGSSTDVGSSSPVVQSYDQEMEIALWNAVKDSKSPTVLQTYLDRFPNGTFAGLARILIDQNRSTASASGPSAAGGAKKVASAPEKSEPSAKVPDTAPATDPAALARALQTELKRVGCDPGALDGKWGPDAREALAEFSKRAKIKFASTEPSQDALQAVAGEKRRVCPLECDRGEREVNGKCVTVAHREPARRVETRRRRAEPDEKPASKGTCWTQDGRNFSVGPCK